MPNLDSPLKAAQEEGDQIKSKIDDIVAKCKNVLENSGVNEKQTEVKELLKRCQKLRKEVGKLEKKVSKLKKSKEPTPLSKFDKMKEDELFRLTSFKSQLTSISDSLKPDEVEEDYFRKQKVHEKDKESQKVKEKDKGSDKLDKQEMKVTEEVEDEDGDNEQEEEGEDEEEESEYEDEEKDDDDESEEDDEDVDEKHPHETAVNQSKPKLGSHVAFTPRTEEDDDNEDEDDEGEEFESEEEEEEEEEEEGEEEEEEGDDESDELEETGSSEDEEDEHTHLFEGEKLFIVLCDFVAEEPTDLSVKQGDVVSILSSREDGWWMAEDEEGNKGLVPSTYLKLKKESTDYRDLQSPEVEDADKGIQPRSGKTLWKSVKKTVTETSVTDVLSAMGAIPAGFRPSLTAQLLKNDENTLCNYLKPRLSESGLSFKDLLWDPHENQLRAVPSRIQKMMSLVMVRNMPAMGVGLEANSRHLRIAIFDGQAILSNIHTVQASWSENDLKTWRFSPRVSGLLPSILDGDCFIRTERTEKKIGLLIEICISYVRVKTGERGELSCGWIHIPLYNEETGGPILNKMYELPVNGGTPFEEGVEVDPSISRRASNNKFRSMLSANKQPRIQIKFITPSREQKTQLESLPNSIVGSASHLPLCSFFRHILADNLLRDRVDVQSTEIIHSPFLSNFPEATRYSDIMDALRSSWVEKKRVTKKAEKRDQEQMKTMFISAFMESAYVLLHSATLPEYKWPDVETEQVRWEAISKFMASTREKGILVALLSPGKVHTPFETSEVSFDILDAYGKR